MMAWLQRHLPMVGVGLILVVNAIALGGVFYNRSGEPESRMELSERELRLPYGRFNRSENSGVSLALQWRVADPSGGNPGYAYESWGGAPRWLDRAKLTVLGFDVLPAKRDAGMSYRLPQTKEVLLVLELDGAAARQALARAQTRVSDDEALLLANPDKKEFEQRAKTAREALKREETESSRLFAVDAGTDQATLRKQYPDRARFAIVRGFVRPQFVAYNKQEQLYGYISALSVSKINVPLDFQEKLLIGTSGGKAKFNATVTWGQRLEPWLMAVGGTAP